MCGCYYYVYDRKTNSYLEEAISTLSLDSFAQGEINPGEQALVLIYENGKIVPCIKRWGFSGIEQKLIYNARYETYKEKKMFSSLRPCIIVCNGFFEWKKTKSRSDKIYVEKRNKEVLYLAGLCDDTHFVILTGKAESWMKKVHSRTPYILDEEKMKAYLKHANPLVVDNEDLTFSLANH